MIEDWGRYPHFSEKEFACKGTDCCGGKANMHPDYMLMLEALRGAVDERFIITSGYRCDAHNARVGSRSMAHPSGQAADIAADGRLMYKMLKLAMLHGFTGIGIKGHGDNRFIHLDSLSPIQSAARPNIWTYS